MCILAHGNGEVHEYKKKDTCYDYRPYIDSGTDVGYIYTYPRKECNDR